MATAGMVLAVIAAGLAIDTGRLGSEKRTDQKVADLAALDAVRDLTDVQALAEASATRNGFPWADPGYGILAELGYYTDRVFTVDPGGNAVRVTATSPFSNSFLPGDRTVSQSAVASQTTTGGFSIGSSLVSVNPARATLLNGVIGRMLGPSAVNLSLVSWQGLAAGNVTLAALRTELATMGFSVATMDQLLDTDLTAAQFLQAAAQAAALNGDTVSANALNALRVAATTSATFRLRQMIEVVQGSEDAALSSQFNLMQLVTGSAQVVNGNNLISVPNASITVPGVSTTSLTLKVLEPPQWYFGPVGGSKSTGQIDLTVTTALNLDISVLGLAGVKVTGNFPVRLQAAGAVGTLTDAVCSGAGAGITVNVDPTAFSGAAILSQLTVNANVILLGNIPILRIPTTTATPSIDGGASDLFFSFPSEFPPPDGATTSKHAGSEPIGLNGLTNISAGSPVVLNAIAAPLVAPIVSAVLAALVPVLSNVDNLVLTPLMAALGVDVGGADVTAASLDCESPQLVG